MSTKTPKSDYQTKSFLATIRDNVPFSEVPEFSKKLILIMGWTQKAYKNRLRGLTTISNAEKVFLSILFEHYKANKVTFFALTTDEFISFKTHNHH